MKILVTGGCGYIGSHTIIALIEAGFEPISIDNNSNSEPWIMDQICRITGEKVVNYPVDLTDPKATTKVFAEHQDIEAVIHFAAFKAVGESVAKPLKYYQNNIYSLINILENMIRFDIDNFVFSSSATVYGNPKELPVTETTPLGKAESPYGATKVMGETISTDFANSYRKNVTLLRYFNPVGAHDSGLLGELPQGTPQNLVPVITKTAKGEINELTVYGDDYDTRDGTCIRDYVHVSDIAKAHTNAIEYLQNNGGLHVFNLGSGDGTTVLEMLQAFEKVNDLKLNYRIGPRRPGDIAKIYADNTKAKQLLDWKIQHDIKSIMRTAWKWEQYLDSRR